MGWVWAFSVNQALATDLRAHVMYQRAPVSFGPEAQSVQWPGPINFVPCVAAHWFLSMEFRKFWLVPR